MAKTKARRKDKEPATSKARRVKLSADESLKRMRDFSKRKEQFVAAVRKGKDRSLSA